jgi:hypothetical protein
MDKLKNNAIYILSLLILLSSMWIPVSSAIQKYKCARLTHVELFARIPNSFILDWKECDD